MTVDAYLSALAASSVLDAKELASINTSIGAIQQRLELFFEGEVAQHFRFGSSTRGTILPRRLDEHSDIDYMVVFAARDAQPQTYLDRLKRFVAAYYKSSDHKQSHPSVVLELNHIKFDLVPATRDWMNSYQIPTQDGGWQISSPADFSVTLDNADKQHGYRLKPTIRLAKIWNANRGYIYGSYEFEKWIASKGFMFCTSLRDYVFHIFDQLNPSLEGTQWRKDELQRAKNALVAIRAAERGGNTNHAAQLTSRLLLG